MQEEGDVTSNTKGLVAAKYYFNRNPRSPELLGIADKPRGFITWNRRVDYYHRWGCINAMEDNLSVL